MMKLEEKALAAVKQYELIHRGDRIAAGISGGADSVALLAFLCAIREDYALELTVCHMNHCLRGEESDRDEKFVRELAARFSLPFVCRRVDIAVDAAESGCSKEETGRRARYAFFAEVAGEDGLIATAHNLNDSMETVLLNLARGTGLRGLCGIPRRRGNIIRPLLGCTRTEIEEYLFEQGLPHVEDSTNASDDYTRNRIRHHILPELMEINPALPQAMERMTEQLSAQWLLTESLADTAQQQFAAAGGGLSRQGLLTLPEPVADRLLMRLLEQAGLPISAAAVERMRRVAKEGGKLDVGERRWYFCAVGDVLLLEEKHLQQKIQQQEIMLPPMGESTLLPLFGHRRIKLTHCYNFVSKQTENFNNCPLKNRLDCDKIKGNLTIRSQCAGDLLRVPHRRVTKPLAKWYAEAGIPVQHRPELFVLADQNGLLWSEAMGADERCCASDKTQNFLIIEVLEEA